MGATGQRLQEAVDGPMYASDARTGFAPGLFLPEVPVLLIGPPGVGKTAMVQATFDHAALLLTSTLVEEDIAGLPYREGEHEYRTVPDVFRKLAEADAAGQSTVLFLDELDKARRAVADTLLTLVASRRVGGVSLPEHTCIVAAANPPDWGGGDGISEAMLSRFAAIEYEPDATAWASWAETKYGAPVASLTEAIRTGEFAIFDTAGEGLERRITTPRTLDRACAAVAAFGSRDERTERLVRGLLTASSASQFLLLCRRERDEVQEKAAAVRRAAQRATGEWAPVRLE